jgi:hypothetical protein
VAALVHDLQLRAFADHAVGNIFGDFAGLY